MSVNLDYIKQIAEAFRAALEDYSQSTNDVVFKDFPDGACGATTDLLARYLIDTIGIDAQYLEARCCQQSHAWVVANNIIIDITADQFGQDPVIVETTSLWHEACDQHPPRPPCDQTEWAKEHFAAWNVIINEMPARGFPKPK